MSKCPNCGKAIPENHWCCKDCLSPLISGVFARHNERRVQALESQLAEAKAEIERLEAQVAQLLNAGLPETRKTITEIITTLLEDPTTFRRIFGTDPGLWIDPIVQAEKIVELQKVADQAIDVCARMRVGEFRIEFGPRFEHRGHCIEDVPEPAKYLRQKEATKHED